MKITIRRSVNAGTVFLNLIAAWDYAALPWYRKVTYTPAGRKALDSVSAGEQLKGDTLLATLDMDQPDNPEGAGGREVKVTPDAMRLALEICLRKGGIYATQAQRVIDDSPACDQDTADCIVQVMAYGELVFGWRRSF